MENNNNNNSSSNKEWRHDVIAKVIHWKLCKINDLPHAEKWYEHKPESVAESDQVKILRDFKIQTDNRGVETILKVEGHDLMG